MKGRTVSRVLSGTIIYLHATLPLRSSDLPAGIGRTTHLLLGLAPDEVFPANPVTRIAVGPYPTISPLPEIRRYIFCGTFCSLSAPGGYPASCSVEPGLSSEESLPRRSSGPPKNIITNRRIRRYRRNQPSIPPEFQFRLQLYGS